MKKNRLGFALGLMLLVGGFATTRFASLHDYAARATTTTGVFGRRAVADDAAITALWDRDLVSVYLAGAAVMTLGAGLAALCVPLPVGWR